MEYHKMSSKDMEEINQVMFTCTSKDYVGKYIWLMFKSERGPSLMNCPM